MTAGMPQLHRRDPANPKKLIPCTLNDLDPSRRTLFVFPGREACRDWPDNYAALFKAMRLAERTLQFDFKDTAHNEQLQIVVAQYDEHETTMDRYAALKSDHTYASPPATDFMADLSARHFTAPISILAWSNGTTFLQQCANAPERPDNIQVLTLGTVLSRDMIARGFPGVYSVGTNDQQIAVYMTDIQDEFLLGRRTEVLSVIPVAQETTGADHAIVVAGPVPNMVERPRAPAKMSHDPDAHAAMGYLEAEGDSHALKGEVGNKRKIPATLLSAVNTRGLNNIVSRSAQLNPTQMLEDRPGLFRAASGPALDAALAQAREFGNNPLQPLDSLSTIAEIDTPPVVSKKNPN